MTCMLLHEGTKYSRRKNKIIVRKKKIHDTIPNSTHSGINTSRNAIN